MEMKSNRPLVDFLTTLTIAAKNLAAEMTNYNLETRDLYCKNPITAEHVQNNTSVREMLTNRGINPSNISLALEMSKGFYFVNIKSKNGTKFLKLIKE